MHRSFVHYVCGRVSGGQGSRGPAGQSGAGPAQCGLRQHLAAQTLPSSQTPQIQGLWVLSVTE